VPVEVPDWNQVFRDPTLPLMVDIGSGTILIPLIIYSLSCLFVVVVLALLDYEQLAFPLNFGCSIQ
jgi:hypothetical protein